MLIGNLRMLTGRLVKEWFTLLNQEQEGCCSLCYDTTDKYRYCVCMGWRNVDIDDGPGEWKKCGNFKYQEQKSHEEWRVYWKIGRQTHNNIMQCDFELDFEMPFVTEEMVEKEPGLCEGDVDNTEEEVECRRTERKGLMGYWHAPVGYKSWNELAACMRKTARRVFRDWKDNDD